MPSAPLNNIVRDVARKNMFPDLFNLLDNTVSFNQGDYLVLKGGLVQRGTAAADTLTGGLGVAPVTVLNGKLPSPYTTDVDASEAPTRIPGPVYGVIALLKLKTADAFDEGDLVFLDIAGDSDGRTVTSSLPAGSGPIGVFSGKSVASAAAGEEGEIHVGQNAPEGVLLF